MVLFIAPKLIPCIFSETDDFHNVERDEAPIPSI